jgi:hypothetical protein
MYCLFNPRNRGNYNGEFNGAECHLMNRAVYGGQKAHPLALT